MYLLLVCLSLVSHSIIAVSIVTDGLKVYVQNDLLEISFKANGTVASLIFNGTNVAADNDETFYLDWHTDIQVTYKPTHLTIVENTTDTVHFYWTQLSSLDNFHIELHYVLTRGISGIYSWAKYINDQELTLSLGTTRTVYRFNSSIFTHATNGVRNDTLYLYSYLSEQTVVQDETWELPDGTYYTKYDFAGYMRETPYQGVYGNGYGAFLISASREYHNGGPLKQELLVHQDSLILNILVGSHFGTPGLSAAPGWNHIYGPFLLYFNAGSDDEILSDIHRRTITEQTSWPYDFVADSDYPVVRGKVHGYISGQTNAAIVLYDSPSEEFDDQALGYLFNTETGDDGYFSMHNVRPGSYKLVAYPLAGQGSENTVEADVIVTDDSDINVGVLNLPEPGNIIWSLGESNRRSSEFKYSSEPRNYVWQTLPPNNLTFIVGQDSPAEGWYYAQTKPGIWTIQYKDTQDGYSRKLRVALAAASNKAKLLVSVNGEDLDSLTFENDKAIYRSAMQSGHYQLNLLNVDSTSVISGTNHLSLQLVDGKVMYDAISLQIKLV